MKNAEFTVIDNDYLSDITVSLAARGLLATMLKLKAENIVDKFSIVELTPLVPDSEYQVRKLLNELERKGYLVRKRNCCNGKVTKWEYIITGSKLSDEDKAQSFRNTSKPVEKIKKAFRRKEQNTDNKNPRLKNQDVEFPHNMIDRYDIKNNTCFKSINQSLVNLQVNVNEQAENQNVETYREITKENISYDYLCDCEDVEEVNCIVDIMTDVVCSEAKEMRVAKRIIPLSALRSIFLKLNENHIQYVLNNLRKTATDIRNIKAYLITSLYNAMQTLQLHTNADVRNCLYGNKAISSGKATDEEVSYDINEFNKFAITFSENTRKKASYDLSKVVPAWMC